MVSKREMESQESLNYNRIARAIEYIRLNFKKQPSLNEIADQVSLSPFHFQKLFTEWAGVSPKQFLQYISIEHAKRILDTHPTSLTDAVYETGLSGTGRLHDLFIKIEGMTPGEYKNGGESLAINYSYAESFFGKLLIASTSRGVCYTAFVKDEDKALAYLQSRFPHAHYQSFQDNFQQDALSIFGRDWENLELIKLHLKGTDFQLKVWETLLKIPLGGLSSYGSIARQIASPAASRAVGTAIGSNPVAFLIPCHRVIQSTGLLGGYMWGENRKAALIGWEAAKISA